MSEMMQQLFTEHQQSSLKCEASAEIAKGLPVFLFSAR